MSEDQSFTRPASAGGTGTGVMGSRTNAGLSWGGTRPEWDRRGGGEDAGGPPEGWVPVFAPASRRECADGAG